MKFMIIGFLIFLTGCSDPSYSSYKKREILNEGGELSKSIDELHNRIKGLPAGHYGYAYTPNQEMEAIKKAEDNYNRQIEQAKANHN